MNLPFLHEPIPLNAPQQEGEIVYTNLELSRLRRTAINFQRVVIAGMVFFLLASTVFATYSYIAAASRAHDLCVQSNSGRAAIRIAFKKQDDKFIQISGPAKQQAVDFENEQLAGLDKALPQRPC